MPLSSYLLLQRELEGVWGVPLPLFHSSLFISKVWWRLVIHMVPKAPLCLQYLMLALCLFQQHCKVSPFHFSECCIWKRNWQWHLDQRDENQVSIFDEKQLYRWISLVASSGLNGHHPFFRERSWSCQIWPIWLQDQIQPLYISCLAVLHYTQLKLDIWFAGVSIMTKKL